MEADSRRPGAFTLDREAEGQSVTAISAARFWMELQCRPGHDPPLSDD